MNKTAQKRRKRRSYFIDKKFQLNFIFRFCLLVLAGGLLTTGLLYLFSLRFTTVAIVNSRLKAATTADFMFPFVLQTTVIAAVIVSILMIMHTLLATHKISGPLYRLKMIIASMAGGDFSADFHIRKRDQLQELAATFNETMKKLRMEQARLKAYFTTMEGKIANLSEEDITDAKRHEIKELKHLAKELNNIIAYFKI